MISAAKKIPTMKKIYKLARSLSAFQNNFAAPSKRAGGFRSTPSLSASAENAKAGRKSLPENSGKAPIAEKHGLETEALGLETSMNRGDG